jgi:hypothetical protein
LSSDGQIEKARELFEKARSEFEDMGVPVYVEEINTRLQALEPFVE